MSVFVAVKEFEEDSQLETLGVSIGDFVLSLDNISVRTHEDLAHAITVAKKNGSKSAVLTVARGEELTKFDVDPSQRLGVILEYRKANDFDWANNCSDWDPETALEAARSTRTKARVYGVGVGFAVGFVAKNSLVDDIGIAIFFGVVLALVGYLVAEIGLHFLKGQRNLAKLEETVHLRSKTPANEVYCTTTSDTVEKAATTSACETETPPQTKSPQNPTIHTHDVESKRPGAVSIFVYATYTWIAINFIDTLDKFQQYNSDGALSTLATNPVLQGPIAGGIIASALGVAFMIFANHRVGKGQNWARYLFLAYSVWGVINILKFNFLAQVLGISPLPGLIRAFLPTLLFLPSSNRWFRTKSKTTGWPLKINIELGGNHQKDSIP